MRVHTPPMSGKTELAHGRQRDGERPAKWIPGDVAEEPAGDPVRVCPSLLNRVIDLYERREQAIAEQVHERFAQKLLGALLQIQACEHRDGASQATAEALGAAKEALGQVIDEASQLVGQLRYPVLGECNVAGRIESLIDQMDAAPKQEIEFLHPGRPTRMLPRVEVAVFRIVQELLINACRHSGATKIRIRLTQDADWLRVEVRDWGVGFEPAGVDRHASGLRSVWDRAELLGGRVTLDTEPGRGTQVVVEIPLVDGLAE